ncbi:MAG TPA: ABC transporter permease [Clostridia bacterium]|nr:ABC transporter permease [Clostridia bacterium]
MTNKRINQMFSMIKTLISIVIAMILAFVVILLVSNEPLNALNAFVTGPLSSLRRFGQMLEYAIPVALCALAVCVTFSLNMSTVIGEGCSFFGGLLATAFILQLGFTGFIAKTIAIVGAGLICALVAAVPMYLKLKFDADLFVASLMLNYVLLYLGLYILNYHFRDPDYGMTASYEMPRESMLTNIIPKTSVTTGLILAIVAMVVIYLVMDKTSFGYQIKLIGSNSKFAKYSGVSIFRISMLASLVGGFLSSMGGAVECLSRNARFQWTALPGYGWDGILIATIAGFKPKNLPLAVLFIAYIRTGADIMNRSSDVAAELVTVVQALMILLIAAKGFLSKAQQRLIVKNAKKLASLEGAK